MTQELLYTSAPRGLKPGTRGFCTVLSTQGMSAPLATALEGLSGYRPLFPADDAQASRNPVNWSHLRLHVGGQTLHILSRIADYGVDYSQRANKLAHHVVLDRKELVPAGPAAVLSLNNFSRTSWEGEPRLVATGPQPQGATSTEGVCRHWQSAMGDAGWAGVIADAFLKDPLRPVILLYQPGQEILPLFAEAISLLPPEKRWEVTFSTYFTGLAAGTQCAWRAMIHDSKEAHESLRFVNALRIDLTKPTSTQEQSELITAARTGHRPQVPQSAAVEAVETLEEATPPIPGQPLLPSQTGKAEIGTYSLKYPASPKLSGPPELKGKRVSSKGTTGRRWKAITAIALLLLAMIGGAGYFTKYLMSHGLKNKDSHENHLIASGETKVQEVDNKVPVEKTTTLLKSEEDANPIVQPQAAAETSLTSSQTQSGVTNTTIPTPPRQPEVSTSGMNPTTSPSPQIATAPTEFSDPTKATIIDEVEDKSGSTIYTYTNIPSSKPLKLAHEYTIPSSDLSNKNAGEQIRRVSPVFRWYSPTWIACTVTHHTANASQGKNSFYNITHLSSHDSNAQKLGKVFSQVKASTIDKQLSFSTYMETDSTSHASLAWCVLEEIAVNGQGGKFWRFSQPAYTDKLHCDNTDNGAATLDIDKSLDARMLGRYVFRVSNVVVNLNGKSLVMVPKHDTAVLRDEKNIEWDFEPIVISEFQGANVLSIEEKTPSVGLRLSMKADSKDEKKLNIHFAFQTNSIHQLRIALRANATKALTTALLECRDQIKNDSAHLKLLGTLGIKEKEKKSLEKFVEILMKEQQKSLFEEVKSDAQKTISNKELCEKYITAASDLEKKINAISKNSSIGESLINSVSSFDVVSLRVFYDLSGNHNQSDERHIMCDIACVGDAVSDSRNTSGIRVEVKP